MGKAKGIGVRGKRTDRRQDQGRSDEGKYERRGKRLQAFLFPLTEKTQEKRGKRRGR